eukprot:scaffold298260_cov32-Tisochrysis_lutea.AAC.3
MQRQLLHCLLYGAGQQARPELRCGAWGHCRNCARAYGSGRMRGQERRDGACGVRRDGRRRDRREQCPPR